MPPPRDDGFDKDLPPDPEVCQAACDTLAGLGECAGVQSGMGRGRGLQRHMCGRRYVCVMGGVFWGVYVC